MNLEELHDALCATNADGGLTAHEKVLEGLAYVLFTVDETLHILSQDPRLAFAWMEPQIQAIYDTVNELMKKLSD